MKVIFYLTKFETISDAVIVYLKIINEALTGEKKLNITDNIRKLKNADMIVTYFVKDYFFARIFNPRAIIVNWYQGILPEESLMWQKSKMRYYVYTLMEWFALKTCKYNFFVSCAMLEHYRQKYNYNGANYYIMPCFNAEIGDFTHKKRDEISFVYIGSLSKWQCIEETLKLFKEINGEIPNASLEILTKEKTKAQELLAKYGLDNVKVNYVSLKELPDYLLKFKYGFLIREDITINRVSTPNKLNTYMASGVVPIYSGVIDAFKIYLDNVKYKIELSDNFNLQNALEQILLFENEVNFDYANMHKEYSEVFTNFYDREKYISDIRNVLITKNLLN
ncbi:hypothetical protein SAMN02927921_02901 [Sinomicrobium oceani]|uniref:Uncharacterized protein n=1 Tax=Sinomicrobium oceani TaxID=1150368 RepID=A0A1K1QVJ2_9FLAO|nr:hypothetical protein [Sinomicrobium oceani]SFW63978.1 hypothetical protein SAMN02927921_02901 [Sinomicrobium oceani]